MVDLNLLESTEDFEKIAKLEGNEFDQYKVIALINLDRFEDASKFAQKGSFEAAYIYYKLKNYKKAIKIVSRFTDERSYILKCQILYAIGFYNKAYEILRNMPKDDEIVINMQAMKSMAILTAKTNSSCGHKLWIKKKDEIVEFDDLENHKFMSEEGRKEFFYNKTLEEADNVQTFIGALKAAAAIFPSDTDNILIRQLNNIEGTFDEIDIDSLNKTQRQILLYNMNKIDKIENSIHFLKNFTGKISDSEYNWIVNARNNNFELDPFSIPSSSDNLKLLRIFIGLKNKKMSKNLILKEADRISNENIRNLIKSYYSVDTVDVDLSPRISNLTI